MLSPEENVHSSGKEPPASTPELRRKFSPARNSGKGILSQAVDKAINREASVINTSRE
jgi:hypothetical protein